MPDLIRSFNSLLALESIQQNNRRQFPFYLQSVAQGHDNARYDILFAATEQQLVLDNLTGLSTPANIENVANIAVTEKQDFLTALDQWFQFEQNSEPVETESETQSEAEQLPFSGGWFLYLGYELAAQIEPVLQLQPSASDWPVAFAVRTPAALINDHLTQTSWLVIEPGFEHLQSVLTESLQFRSAESTHAGSNLAAPTNLLEQAPADYLSAIETVKQYIREGDVFQVNLSRQWLLEYAQPVDAAAVYQQLCQANPAPFAGLVYWQNAAIASSSPERLVQTRGGVIRTQPIAGTYPRSSDAGIDQDWSNELLAHPKERAEHIMLIDLERNDMGRVCKAGSIQVDALMTVESFAHVHHIVSTISGELETNVSPGQVIRAVFPGGTITGCPKIRCMEIINELENQGRGFYTGSFGYLNRNGDMDLNILIRTMVIEQNRIGFRAGGGIVYDSVPDKELAETRAKAKGLLYALTRISKQEAR